MITENNNNQGENEDGSLRNGQKKNKRTDRATLGFSATKHISPCSFFLRGGGARIVKMEEKKEKHGSSGWGSWSRSYPRDHSRRTLYVT